MQSLFDSSRWAVLALFTIIAVAHAVSFKRVSPRFFDFSALVFLAMISLCLLTKTVTLMLKAARQGESE